MVGALVSWGNLGHMGALGLVGVLSLMGGGPLVSWVGLRSPGAGGGGDLDLLGELGYRLALLCGPDTATDMRSLPSFLPSSAFKGYLLRTSKVGEVFNLYSLTQHRAQYPIGRAHV